MLVVFWKRKQGELLPMAPKMVLNWDGVTIRVPARDCGSIKDILCLRRTSQLSHRGQSVVESLITGLSHNLTRAGS